MTAVDIAEYTVKLLEDEELFNAGKGSVYTSEETHEMDAAIMDGETLRCGSVSQLRIVKNPISAARLVMQHPNHNFIVGSTVESLAAASNLSIVPLAYFDTKHRYDQYLVAKNSSTVALDHDINVKLDQSENDATDAKGTVGCVCMFRGSVAAATSTGGMTCKLPGRVGDSPIIGAGTYANNQTCAVSATGNGEEFIRQVIAHDVSARMKYARKSIHEASRDAINVLPDDCGGLIAVDKLGNYAVPFNSSGMFRAVALSNGTRLVGIWEEMENI